MVDLKMGCCAWWLDVGIQSSFRYCPSGFMEAHRDLQGGADGRRFRERRKVGEGGWPGFAWVCMVFVLFHRCFACFLPFCLFPKLLSLANPWSKYY